MSMATGSTMALFLMNTTSSTAALSACPATSPILIHGPTTAELQTSPLLLRVNNTRSIPFPQLPVLPMPIFQTFPHSRRFSHCSCLFAATSPRVAATYLPRPSRSCATRQLATLWILPLSSGCSPSLALCCGPHPALANGSVFTSHASCRTVCIVGSLVTSAASGRRPLLTCPCTKRKMFRPVTQQNN